MVEACEQVKQRAAKRPRQNVTVHFKDAAFSELTTFGSVFEGMACADHNVLEGVPGGTVIKGTLLHSRLSSRTRPVLNLTKRVCFA